MLPANINRAVDHFLPPEAESPRSASARGAAKAAVEAWREGRISTAEVLRTLAETFEGLRTLDA